MSRSAFRQSTLKAPASKKKKVPHRTNEKKKRPNKRNR